MTRISISGELMMNERYLFATRKLLSYRSSPTLLNIPARRVCPVWRVPTSVLLLYGTHEAQHLAGRIRADTPVHARVGSLGYPGDSVPQLAVTQTQVRTSLPLPDGVCVRERVCVRAHACVCVVRSAVQRRYTRVRSAVHARYKRVTCRTSWGRRKSPSSGRRGLPTWCLSGPSCATGANKQESPQVDGRYFGGTSDRHEKSKGGVQPEGEAARSTNGSNGGSGTHNGTSDPTVAMWCAPHEYLPPGPGVHARDGRKDRHSRWR